jgi:NarL family two-component system response regulator LiaR
MVRVAICDDQFIVCEGLQMILDSDPELEVVGVAHDGAEACQLVEKTKPDLILMDLKMPHMNGIVATRQIRMNHPDVHILVLTTYDDDEWLFDAIRSGAAGYLLKDTPPNELIAAIKGTVSGKAFVDPSVTSKLLSEVSKSGLTIDSPTHFSLTDREREVLQLIVEGLSNADIAERLFLAEGTVRNYTSTVFRKLGVSDRTQAAVLALRHGLVDSNSSS